MGSVEFCTLQIQELLKFIPSMKWQAFPLLVSICSAGLQRSGRKISDVSELSPRGLPCKKNGETFCHGNVVRKYGRSYGNICDNGDITLMRMESGYSGPQPCVEGEIFYINKVTGLKFQKGRLGSSSGADNTKNKATTAINKTRSTTRTTTKTTKVPKVSTTSV